MPKVPWPIPFADEPINGDPWYDVDDAEQHVVYGVARDGTPPAIFKGAQLVVDFADMLELKCWLLDKGWIEPLPSK